VYLVLNGDSVVRASLATDDSGSRPGKLLCQEHISAFKQNLNHWRIVPTHRSTFAVFALCYAPGYTSRVVRMRSILVPVVLCCGVITADQIKPCLLVTLYSSVHIFFFLSFLLPFVWCIIKCSLQQKASSSIWVCELMVTIGKEHRSSLYS